MEDFASNDAPINQLPDECLGYIFTFLPILERPKVEQVCKHWRIISEKGWNDIKTLDIDEKYSDDIIRLMLKRCGFLKELTINESKEQLTHLSMVIELCRLDYVEKIIIWVYLWDENELNTHYLREIFRRSQKLVTLKIIGGYIRNRIDHLDFSIPRTLRKLELHNEDEDLLPIINVDRFPNLKELLISCFTVIGDERERAEDSLKDLEILHIRLCRLSQNIIQRIVTFKNLRELTLRLNDYDMTNEQIRSIVRHCHKMEKLCLSCAPSMTSECFQYFGEMPLLEDLELQGFVNVKRSEIACLTNVKHLILANSTCIYKGRGLTKLIKNSANLQTLELILNRTMNITSLNNVAQIFHRGERMKPLRLELNIRSYGELRGVAWDTFHHPLLEFSVFKW